VTSKNDVTGDSLVSKVASEDYRKNYDNIFGKKDKPEQHKAVDDTAGIEEESNDKS
jgi:hypothetical protein